jgi:hypothetical protein
MAARRTDRPAAAGRSPAGRETRASSRMAEGAGDETQAAPKPGMGITEAMGIVTFLMLIAAILLVDYTLGTHYGTGMFFKK